ncbi:hypothetical protein KBB96_19385 [Luteolibacter ambystomatis]|uniref:Uncharacterized protein n=1 Tax=Luteolibacter ambystomatis TaxID=2824561 RepID=A0A975G960_9BACT|nr:hypothetical protein [Luteolibacter ambystomatis]QUE51005.1 hypothetical protein KBB96_19385 [Luteolibacter ambystomatis]
MNRAALTLLIVAAVLYGIAMLVPMGGDSRGWSLWVEVVEIFGSKDWQEEAQSRSAVLAAGFVTLSFLAMGGPFLFPLVRASRPTWWVVVVLCAFPCAAVAVLWRLREGEDLPGGSWWLVAALVAHLGGLFCVRGAARKVDA